MKAIHITMPSFNFIFGDPLAILNLIALQFLPSYLLTEGEIKHNFIYKLSDYGSVMLKETGYFHLQATKPDTLGFGLTDSPVGLMAYYLEKYAIGTFRKNCFGHKDGLLNKFDRDELLTIITYYWMTNSATSSCQMYKNAFYNFQNWPNREIRYLKIKTPAAVQYFKNEFITIPYAVLKYGYLNLKRFNIENQGGHFAAFENPELTAKDFVEFIKSVV